MKNNYLLSFLLSTNILFADCQETTNCFTKCIASSDWESCIKSCKLPDFKRKTIDDKIIDTENLKGKIIFLNFWNTACAPCIAEFAALNRLVEEYKNRNVVFVGVTSDPIKKIKGDFLDKHNFKFQIIGDALPIIEQFGVVVFPVTLIIDQDGKITKGWMGGFTDSRAETIPYEKGKAAIDLLLNK